MSPCLTGGESLRVGKQPAVDEAPGNPWTATGTTGGHQHSICARTCVVWPAHRGQRQAVQWYV